MINNDNNNMVIKANPKAVSSALWGGIGRLPYKDHKPSRRLLNDLQITSVSSASTGAHGTNNNNKITTERLWLDRQTDTEVFPDWE